MDFELLTALIPLVAGWLLDLWLGDPEKCPHPIVYMGKWISFFEKKLNKGSHKTLKGAIFAIASVAATFCITLLVTKLPSVLLGEGVVGTIVRLIIETTLIFFCLAGHTLRKEVKMVFETIEKDLDLGRKQVARIVGRDTSELTENEVKTAALETLAENLSDGVIAPLFWFGLLGVPGMIAYKMVNTMDSMIGYKDPKYKDYGCWAAKTDDLANYIPARLTAALMVLANNKMKNKKNKKTTLSEHASFVMRNGRKHASPNSGWPEAALAGALDCRFGGPHLYFGKMVDKPYIGENERNLDKTDLKTSTIIALTTEYTGVMLTLTTIIYRWAFQ